MPHEGGKKKRYIKAMERKCLTTYLVLDMIPPAPKGLNLSRWRVCPSTTFSFMRSEAHGKRILNSCSARSWFQGRQIPKWVLSSKVWPKRVTADHTEMCSRGWDWVKPAGLQSSTRNVMSRSFSYSCVFYVCSLEWNYFPPVFFPFSGICIVLYSLHIVFPIHSK